MRCVRLINAFGPKIRHAIVSAQPHALGAAQYVLPSVPTVYPRGFPQLTGFPGPGRLRRLAQAMRGHDLVLTYNWGAMDAVMAHTVYGKVFNLPPLVHHEDGFNEDEAQRLKSSRNWYRRIALGGAQALVVPSILLERIARGVWYQPDARVHRIANGIASEAYRKPPRKDALRGIVKHKGEFWLGTLAGLRPVKNLGRLVRAMEKLPENWQLVILGEGPERAALRAEADRLGVAHRVHLPGFAPDPAKAVGLFDLFALSSESEQFPISVVEAMAAGLAVAAPAVGDIAAMVSVQNRPFIVAPGDENALVEAIAGLARDKALRCEIGVANQAKAQSEYDEAGMIAAYRALYAGVMGQEDLP